ncbi:hypothetical protein ACVGOW_01190 [Pseudonocardia saturnea]
MRVRVKSLHYDVSFPDDTKIVAEAAPTLMVELPGFECELGHEELLVRPLAAYGDEASAVAALWPLLDAWQATTELEHGYPLAFKFVRSQLEELEPSPNATVVFAGVAEIGVVAEGVRVTQLRKEFPGPAPEVTRVGDLTLNLMQRIRRMKNGEELVTGGAYYILTTLEGHLGGKSGIASTLNTTVGLLDKLGKLASTEDPVYGRKGGGRTGNITSDDLRWLQAACRSLTARLLRHEAGASIPERLQADDVGAP